MYRIVLFDLDGTLIDTSPGIFSTANYTMNLLGYPALDDQGLRKFVGPPLAECFRIACGLDESLIGHACEVYREAYAESGAMFQAAVYHGIPELLTTLHSRGITFGVATLKLEFLAREMLEYFGLLSFFSVVSGADRAGTYSKADIIVHALNTLQHSQRTDVLLVGDTDIDCHGADRANVHFIGVDWGFGFTRGQQVKTSDTVLGIISEPASLLNHL